MARHASRHGAAANDTYASRRSASRHDAVNVSRRDYGPKAFSAQLKVSEYIRVLLGSVDFVWVLLKTAYGVCF